MTSLNIIHCVHLDGDLVLNSTHAVNRTTGRIWGDGGVVHLLLELAGGPRASNSRASR